MKRSEKTSLAIFLTIYAFIFSFTIPRGYLPKSLIPAMIPSFADLRMITSASDCLQDSRWSLISITCDPWGRPYNYPSVWVKIFSIMGLTLDDTVFLGIVQIILLSIFFGLWVFLSLELINHPKDRNSLFILVILFVLSPPVLLLLERGNIDSWIFIGLSVVSYLMISGKFFLPIGLLSLMGALKIYPFVVFLFIFRNFKLTLRSAFVLIAVLGSTISLAGEWQIILERSITTWNFISYGSNMVPLLFFQILEVEASKALTLLVGWSIFALLVLVLSRFCDVHIRGLRIGVQNSVVSRVSLRIFGASFLFSFLVGASFDLRLVLLFPVFVCLFPLTETATQKKFLSGAVVCIMYGGQFTSSFGEFGLLINLCSDFVLSIFSAFLLLLIFPNAKERNLI